MPNDETPDEVRRWFLSTVQNMWPVAEGSLSLRRSPCVRKNCEACAKHQSYILYGRREGRRSSVYVPDALAEQVQTAIENGRDLQQLMSEAGVRYVNALKTARRKP
jgi:molybdopterin-guanine dinucleotide biosynthesis protein A